MEQGMETAWNATRVCQQHSGTGAQGDGVSRADGAELLLPTGGNVKMIPPPPRIPLFTQGHPSQVSQPFTL